MSAFLITAIVGGLLLIMSIVLLTGRGAFLIAGYNTMPKRKKAQYNKPAMCRFTGKILLPISILTIIGGIEALHAPWFWIVFGVIVMGLCVFALIYSNTGNRFKK